MSYRWLFDNVLTHVEAERAHRLGFQLIRLRNLVVPTRGDHRRIGWGAPVSTMGLQFRGVLGLAAGFDKNAVGVDALAALGFGFVEVGTVTALPQPGNPRPRLFRLPADRAVVNRMGFNNDGAEAVAHRLAHRLAQRRARPRSGSGLDEIDRHEVVVGVNIGKSKVVPDDDDRAVVADYCTSTRLLAPYADYLVLNVSSPNTPGLRGLQSVDRLAPLARAVRAQAQAVTDAHLPLLVKIAPDLAEDDVFAVADLATHLRLDGIVATNTTVTRSGLVSSPALVSAAGPGGLSGVPLRTRAVEVLRLLRKRVGEEMTIVGVGGIATVDDARERLEAGADLLQAYTAFVYEGPGWPREMQRALATGMAPR
jgi:dihydroorotate dehydrogenase